VKNKKAMFFTIVALTFVAIAILAMNIDTKYRLKEKASEIETRVNTMNKFVRDTERDLERAFYIASFRSILGMNQYISLNGTYIDDAGSAFRELAVNGTLYSTEINVTNTSHLRLWEQKVNERANSIGISINFTDFEIEIGHSDAWTISIELDTVLSLWDNTGMASWTRDMSASTTLPVEGFEDPLYTLESNGLYLQKIEKTPYTDFVDEATNDTTDLIEHAEGNYYINSTIAPSFLMRFEGNLSNSSFGIESLVYAEELIPINLYEEKSIVDHIYWSDSDPEAFRIKNTNAWFRLDNESGRLEMYEVDYLILD